MAIELDRIVIRRHRSLIEQNGAVGSVNLARDRTPPPNSPQKLARPGFGPPAEPAR